MLPILCSVREMAHWPHAPNFKQYSQWRRGRLLSDYISYYHAIGLICADSQAGIWSVLLGVPACDIEEQQGKKMEKHVPERLGTTEVRSRMWPPCL